MLGSISGPNRDEPCFYEKIDEILDNVDCDHIVLGGDFNFVMKEGTQLRLCSQKQHQSQRKICINMR